MKLFDYTTVDHNEKSYLHYDFHNGTFADSDCFNTTSQNFKLAVVDGYIVDENSNPVSDMYVNSQYGLYIPSLAVPIGLYALGADVTDSDGHYSLIVPKLVWDGIPIIPVNVEYGDEEWNGTVKGKTCESYINDGITGNITVNTRVAKSYSKIYVDEVINNKSFATMEFPEFVYTDNDGIKHEFSAFDDYSGTCIKVFPGLNGFVRYYSEDKKYLEENDPVISPPLGQTIHVERTLASKFKKLNTEQFSKRFFDNKQ